MDCGALIVEFFNDDAGTTALDTDILLDDRTTTGAFNLASIYTEDVLKPGQYPIKYRVYHTTYTGNVVTSADPFSITIADPCDAPVSVVASTLSNQEYTITDDDASPYTVPIYTADPAWCAIRYTYTITDVSGDAVLTFNDDPLTREFAFSYSADLLLSGADNT